MWCYDQVFLLKSIKQLTKYLGFDNAVLKPFPAWQFESWPES